MSETGKQSCDIGPCLGDLVEGGATADSDYIVKIRVGGKDMPYFDVVTEPENWEGEESYDPNVDYDPKYQGPYLVTAFVVKCPRRYDGNCDGLARIAVSRSDSGHSLELPVMFRPCTIESKEGPSDGN